ncbi:hypothetical protein GCM10007352_11370 [Mucilaginibacter phyllosphaerae]|nr:hypothetical protein GCM10007352_11370 [Mucilaginibacter phyllosphaerae]
MGTASQSQAQVYYVTQDGVNTTKDVNDAIRRMDYTGANITTIASNIAYLPGLVTLDLAGNRVFHYEGINLAGTAQDRSIKVRNATTGSLINSIPVPYSVNDIKYDAATDYLYFITTNAGVSTGVEDALYKCKPTDSAPTLIASSITTSPLRLALDIPNSRVFIWESVPANRGIKVFSLSSNTITSSITAQAGTISSMDYDPVAGSIYYLTNDGSASSLGATDALYKIDPDGNNSVTIKSSLTTSPVAMGLDAGNNRAYIYEGLAASRAIKTVNLTTGDVAQIVDLTSQPAGVGVNSFGVPLRAVLSTSVVTVASTSATLGGNVTRSDVTVTERGVVYSSTNSLPTTNDSKAVNGSGTGAFSATITGLSPVTPYNVRAYAISGAGISYGAVRYFITSSNDATLSGLSLSSGTLNPSFSGSVISYSAGVTNSVTSITVTPTLNQSGATVKVNGSTVASGSASGNISLNAGDNVITTVVTAQDGTTTKTYTITVTRDKAPQTINFAATATKTYGDADYAPGATSSRGLAITYSSDNAAVATIVNNLVHIVGAGTANITASQAGNASTLAAANVTQVLTVNQKALTITANPSTKVYGDNEPAFTYTTTGLVTGDSPTGALSRNTSGINNNIIGNYPITLGTLSFGNNYNVTYVSANLTITKRPVTLRIADRTKVYGDTDPNLNSFAFASGSVAPGLTLGTTGIFTRVQGENVGTYSINGLGDKRIIGNDYQSANDNYTITLIPGTLTITPKAVTVTATGITKSYGDADPALTYTNTELGFSDTFTGSLTRATGETVGTYAISQGSLALSNNYTLSFTGSNLTINKKIINVTATALTKSYGDPNPALTYTADALAFSDSFTGSLTRVAGETPGNYAISQGSLALNSNYTLNYTGANLTIGAKIINVTAAAASKTYGEADPALTYTADALLNGDSFTGAISRTPGETAGNYAITQGTLALNSNYAINYTGANLTIRKLDISVNVYEHNVPYGDPEASVLGYSYSGTLVSGDAFTGMLSRQPGNAIGTYAITQNTLTLSNSASYNLIYNGANYNIIPRPITLSSVFATKIYGEADPSLAYRIISGSLLSGDAITGSVVRVAGENSGPYAVNQGTVAINNTNYALTYQPGSFEIDRAPLTVTADNKTKLAGEANPAFTYTITGFKNNETEAVFLQPVDVTTFANINSPAGTYNISPYNAIALNYDISFVAGTLTVRDASTNANLASLSVAEGTIAPSFDPAVTSYSLAVGEQVNTVNITASLADANAKLFRIYGTNATSGQAMSVPVSGGDNQISILVIAEDNSTSKEYLVNISKPYNTDATLSALNVTGGTALSPAFDPAKYNYTVTVPNQATSIQIAPVANSQYGFIQINGESYEGNYSPTLAAGNNVFTIVVAAQDRSVTQTYTLTVVRANSTNSTLAALSANPGTTLSPVFDAATSNYTVKINEGEPSIKVIATAADAGATIKINDAVVASGATYTQAFSSANITVNVLVTAADGVTTSSYAITATHVSGNAIISRIDTDLPNKIKAVSNTASLAEYTATVGSEVTSFSIKPELSDPQATITINGVSASNMVYSAPVPVSAGVNVVDVVATAKNGLASKVYRIRVTKIVSSNPALSAIETSPNIALKLQSSNSNLSTYRSTVGINVNSFSIKPTAANIHATISINGSPATNGVFSGQIPVNVGLNMIDVVVTAEDGVAVKTYRLFVTKVLSNNALLSTIATNPSLKLKMQNNTATLTEYTAAVGANISNINVIPTTNDINATVTVNGVSTASGADSAPVAINVGLNTIDVVVTAADNTTVKTYRLLITKTISNNALLSSITTNPDVSLKLVSNSTTLSEYTAILNNSITSIAFKGLLNYSNASLTLNGEPVANNTFSSPVPMAVGSNFVEMVVLAEDGVTSKTYRITLTRQMGTLMVDRNDSKFLFANKSANSLAPANNDGVVVRQGVSPNGDGSNDFLVIEGIAAYSGNKVSIMNTNGSLVYETKEYGNNGNVFDGHAKNGSLLKPGTYFYALDYKVGQENKRKTGYIVLKY